MKAEADTGAMHLQAKERQGLPANTRSHERGMGWFLPYNSQKEPALLVSGFQTSGLQNCERINICCFSATKCLVVCNSSSRERIHHVNM